MFTAELCRIDSQVYDAFLSRRIFVLTDAEASLQHFVHYFHYHSTDQIGIKRYLQMYILGIYHPNFMMLHLMKTSVYEKNCEKIKKMLLQFSINISLNFSIFYNFFQLCNLQIYSFHFIVYNHGVHGQISHEHHFNLYVFYYNKRRICVGGTHWRRSQGFI